MSKRMGIGPDPEKLDTTPIEMPLGMRRPRPLTEVMAEMIRNHVLDQKSSAEFETWEEANDFEADDLELLDFTKYELAEGDPDFPVDWSGKEDYEEKPKSPQTLSEAPQEPKGEEPGGTPGPESE